MNKKMKLIFSIAIAFIATVYVFTPTRNKEVIDVRMGNIEALASGEGSSTICIGSGTIDCGGYKCEFVWTY